MGKRFVEIPADRLTGLLEQIGGKVKHADLGSWSWHVAGRERVFDLVLFPKFGVVRIYTSLSIGGARARACGKDAVRVVVGAMNGDEFVPIESGQKILRTAPQGEVDRVAVFLNRLKVQIRQAYKRAAVVRYCPECGSLMRYRKGKYGPFYGCTSYPDCKHIDEVEA